MKKSIFYSTIFAAFFCQNLYAQCIKDIQNLINMPAPCFFVGNIDYDNLECFDVFSYPTWQYTWKIRSADNGKMVASYEGIAFQHTFKKFGGYQFCLEIEKDGNQSNGPELVDCVTYTTCEICTGDSIKITYNSCPYGEGCDITLTADIEAQNDFGLRPVAKFIVTYLPTPQELLGGIESYEIEFDDIDIEYNPFNDSIHVSQSLTVPFRRGCFKPRIEFQMVDGYGAHGPDGIACSTAELRSEEKFRCIACANQDGACIASEVASQISNEEDSCDPFYFCNQFRETEDNWTTERQSTKLEASPNPAYENLHLSFPASNAANRKLAIFNNIGQEVIQRDLSSDDLALDIRVGNLQHGIYFAILMENGQLVSTSQIIIGRQ